MKPFTHSQKNRLGHLTDKDLIRGLKQRDGEITHYFFYEICSYLLNDIRVSLMNWAMDYDDLVNELYIYLSANDWHKLDTFSGINGCTLRSWLVRISWRFFMKRKAELLGLPSDDGKDVGFLQESVLDGLHVEMRMDVEIVFAAMSNPKYVEILKLLLIEGYGADEVAEKMGIRIANVYNIKHRAIVQFVKTFGDMDV